MESSDDDDSSEEDSDDDNVSRGLLGVTGNETCLVIMNLFSRFIFSCNWMYIGCQACCSCCVQAHCCVKEES